MCCLKLSQKFNSISFSKGSRASRLGGRSNPALGDQLGGEERRSSSLEPKIEDERGAQPAIVVDGGQTPIGVQRPTASSPEGADARARREKPADAGAGKDKEARRGAAPGEGRDHQGTVEGAPRDRELQAPAAAAGNRVQHPANRGADTQLVAQQRGRPATARRRRRSILPQRFPHQLRRALAAQEATAADGRGAVPPVVRGAGVGKPPNAANAASARHGERPTSVRRRNGRSRRRRCGQLVQHCRAAVAHRDRPHRCSNSCHDAPRAAGCHK